MFDSPLFGAESTGNFRLYANQSLGDGAVLGAWFADGFPNYVSDYGISATGLAFAGARADVAGGDFVLGPLRPASFLTVSRETYPLRGASLHLRGDDDQWHAFVGTAKFFEQPPSGASSPPTLAGMQRLHRRRDDHFGLGLTAVGGAPYLAPGEARPTAAILSGNWFRDIDASRKVWGEGMLLAAGDAAGRFGAQLRRPTWDLSAQIYAFGDAFPFVTPFYRPGERGVELAARVEPAAAWTISGYANWLRDTLQLGRAELRGDLGVGFRPGGTAPSLHLSWARNDVTYDSRSVATPGSTADRVTFLAARSRTAGHWLVRAEQVLRDSLGGPRRTQATFDYRSVVAADSFLTGSTIAQREETGDWGATIESAVERPLPGPWSWIAGLGVGYLERGGARSGEGVLRAGVAHRFSREGWFARLELRAPVDIGLDRSHLATRTVAFDLGTKVGWRGDRSDRGRFGPRDGEAEGAIEGVVTIDGRGVGGLSILVDGEPAAVTRSDGHYRVSRLRAGVALLTLDLRNVDARYGVVGGAYRTLGVGAGEPTIADFLIARFSYLQGAVVACKGSREVAVAGARVVARRDLTERAVETSGLGGFQMDELPPGLYELRIERSGHPEVTRPVDLREDVRGLVLRIDCEKGDSPLFVSEPSATR